MKIILGDISYPKSKALILPANASGIMNKGVPKRIVKEGWRIIERQAKEQINKRKYDLGECFKTGPGRLKRRGLENIYHAIIKNLPSDLVSMYIIQKALDNAFLKVIKDKLLSVTVPGIGINESNLDCSSIADIISRICIKYNKKIEIRIIDDNEEFIREVSKFLNLKYDVKMKKRKKYGNVTKTSIDFKQGLDTY